MPCECEGRSLVILAQSEWEQLIWRLVVVVVTARTLELSPFVLR